MTALDIAALDAGTLDTFRPALRRYCYRMLASAADADDAVQETMVRAWRGLDRFEGKAPLEAWLYRIATNVCLNLLRSRRRRALPMDLEEASDGTAPLGRQLPPASWVEPLVDSDPAQVATDRDSVRLAFVAALQLLPPRQRAVLILRDVLRWRAEEVATLLDTSEASVKSALQRARATLAANRAAPSVPVDPALLHRYLDAFSRFDVDALVRLLRDDAVLSMPPYSLWLSGAADIAAWLEQAGGACRASVFTPILVNGTWGAQQFKALVDGGPPEPFAVHALEGDGRQIVSMHIFLEPR